MNMKHIRGIERLNYMLGAVMIIIAALTATRSTALGVVVGVALASVNFSIIRRIITGWLTMAARAAQAHVDDSGAQSGKGTGRALFLAPKFALLVAALLLALTFLPINAKGLLIGFSVVVLSIAVETIIYLSAQSSELADGPQSGSGHSADDPEI